MCAGLTEKNNAMNIYYHEKDDDGEVGGCLCVRDQFERAQRNENARTILYLSAG